MSRLRTLPTLVTLWAALAALAPRVASAEPLLPAVTVSGHAFLDGQADHSGVVLMQARKQFRISEEKIRPKTHIRAVASFGNDTFVEVHERVSFVQ